MLFLLLAPRRPRSPLPPPRHRRLSRVGRIAILQPLLPSFRKPPTCESPCESAYATTGRCVEGSTVVKLQPKQSRGVFKPFKNPLLTAKKKAATFN